MTIFTPTLLETIYKMQDILGVDVIESTSSNPGLIIASLILVMIIIGGVILHSYSPKAKPLKEKPLKKETPKED